MKLGIPSVDKFSIVVNTITKSSTFLGGLVSTNAPTSPFPQWDSTKTDYKIGDWVNIAALKKDFVCGQDGNMEHPAYTAFWEEQTQNDYRQIDDTPTTKTTHNADIVNIYSVDSKDMFVAQFINNCKEVVIDSCDVAGTVISNIDTVDMTEIIQFQCFNCCNPEPVQKRWIAISIMEDGVTQCDNRYIKVTFKIDDVLSPIEIGTATVVRTNTVGCLRKGTSIQINKNFQFQEARLTENTNVVRWGTTMTLDATTLISAEALEFIEYTHMMYDGFVFGILDDADTVDNKNTRVVMGVFNPATYPALYLKKAEFKFKIEGVLA